MLDGIGPAPTKSWSANAKDAIDSYCPPQAKWRALRRLAKQGGDSQRELQFLKGEIQARRGREDRWTGLFYWIGWAYQITADFGLSVLRPALLLLASIVVFAAAYAAQGEPGWSEYLPVSDEAIEHEDRCSPLVSAMVLSAHGVFPFAGIGRAGQVAGAYDCRTHALASCDLHAASGGVSGERAAWGGACGGVRDSGARPLAVLLADGGSGACALQRAPPAGVAGACGVRQGGLGRAHAASSISGPACGAAGAGEGDRRSGSASGADCARLRPAACRGAGVS